MTEEEVVLRRFDAEMRPIYDRAAAEASYYPTRFLQMLSEQGGLATARHLLHGQPSDGLGRLALEGRLDLAVESLVQRPEFRHLFTDAELRTAVERVGDRSADPGGS